MFTVAGPVAGRVTGEGENDTVEFVCRSGCAFAGAGGLAGAGAAAAPGPAAAPGDGGVAGAGVAGGFVPVKAGLRCSRVNVSEPVFRPRILISLMSGIRTM